MFGTIADKIEKNYIPIAGSFELTWRCNLNCRYCYQYRNDTNELTMDEIKRILDELCELQCLFLSFTGGEPLLRKDFWDIAEYAKTKLFSLTLQTNGTLITKDYAKKIKELNFFDVHITLSGAKPQTHDWFTQSSGSFDKTMQAIEFLRTCNIRVTLTTTAIKQNFSELKGMQRIARKFGCQHVMTPLVCAKNNGDKSPHNFRIDDWQMKNFYSAIFKKVPRYKRDYKCHAGEIVADCRAGRTGFCINPVGEIYPCVGLPVPAGSLRNANFKQIWDSSDFLKEIREERLDALSQCSKCDLRPICIRCKGMAYIEDGGLLEPSKEACRIANIVKEVIEDEKKNV